MNMHLLAIESLWMAVALGLISFLVMIFIEALIMTIFKLNPLGRNVRDSLLANIGSALLCLLLILILNKIEIEGLTHLMIFSVFFLVSSFFESWIIKLLNKQLNWSRILAASLVMNLVTYTGSYYLFTTYMY